MLAALALTNASGAVLDFSSATPVYDANRSTTTQGADAYYYPEIAGTATIGFNWSNSQWGKDWYYSWDGFNISNCKDLTVDVSRYYEAGQKASYTSITGTNAAGVAGGSYAVFYGNTSSATPNYSSSDAGMVMFNGDLVNFTSVSIAHTLVTYDYFSKNLDPDGNNWIERIEIYSIDSNFEITQNFVSVSLSDIDGVDADWQTVDLSSLNTAEGLAGLSFKIWTNNFNDYGALAPAYFAMDGLTYTPIPEASTYAAILGLISFGAIILRRKNAK